MGKMKRLIFISVLAWMIALNFGKVFPLSKGEKYYRNLQRWYLLANEGNWERASKIEKKLKSEDVGNFKKNNKSEELRLRVEEINKRENKTADDWMEIAVLSYRLNEKDKAYKAIENAYRMDPIREDISKIYFTFRKYLL